jgi:hypothetical protein
MRYTHHSILLLICLTVSFASFVAAQENQSSDLFVIMVDNKVGFINRTGKIVIEPQFNGANDFSEGLAIVGLFDTDKRGFIDKTGKIVIPAKFEDAWDFSEGLSRVSLGKCGSPNSGKQKIGFIDKTGKFVIKPKCGDFYSFNEGLALTFENGKYGFIGKTGKIVIPIKFESATHFSEGFSTVFVDGKYGFIDKTGKLIIEPQFTCAGGFSEGLANVKIGGEVCNPHRETGTSGVEDATHGYIDKAGRLVIELDKEFIQTNPFSEGVGIVSKSGEYYLIDKMGKLTAIPKYGGQRGFSEGLMRIIIPGGKFVFIDKTGVIILRTDFDSADNFRNGLSQVAEGKYPPDAKYGYIDKTGKVIWQPTK